MRRRGVVAIISPPMIEFRIGTWNPLAIAKVPHLRLRNSDVRKRRAALERAGQMRRRAHPAAGQRRLRHPQHRTGLAVRRADGRQVPLVARPRSEIGAEILPQLPDAVPGGDLHGDFESPAVPGQVAAFGSPAQRTVTIGWSGSVQRDVAAAGAPRRRRRPESRGRFVSQTRRQDRRARAADAADRDAAAERSARYPLAARGRAPTGPPSGPRWASLSGLMIARIVWTCPSSRSSAQVLRTLAVAVAHERARLAVEPRAARRRCRSRANGLGEAPASAPGDRAPRRGAARPLRRLAPAVADHLHVGRQQRRADRRRRPRRRRRRSARRARLCALAIGLEAGPAGVHVAARP